MMPSPNVLWLAVLTLALASPVPAGVAWAQAPAPKADMPKADKLAPPLPSLPATPAERDSILADLYGKLARSDSAKEAKAVQARIERVWLHSGSPTTDLLLQRAMRTAARKDFDRALRFLDHVVEQAPDFTEGWNRRAFVHYQREEVALAVGDLRRALALDPSNFRALDGLAKIWRDIDRKPAALAVLRRLAEVHPHWRGTDRAIEELARDVDGQGI